MAGNPLVQQGTLNRLRASVVFADNATFNVTAAFLGREGIRVALEGDASQLLPTMTGGVPSPEPYQMAVVTLNLLKSQGFADIWKARIESDTNMGDCSVISDSSELSDYALRSCTLLGVHDLPMDGNSPMFAVTMRAIYDVNSSMWNII